MLVLAQLVRWRRKIEGAGTTSQSPFLKDRPDFHLNTQAAISETASAHSSGATLSIGAPSSLYS